MAVPEQAAATSTGKLAIVLESDLSGADFVAIAMGGSVLDSIRAERSVLERSAPPARRQSKGNPLATVP